MKPHPDKFGVDPGECSPSETDHQRLGDQAPATSPGPHQDMFYHSPNDSHERSNLLQTMYDENGNDDDNDDNDDNDSNGNNDSNDDNDDNDGTK